MQGMDTTWEAAEEAEGEEQEAHHSHEQEEAVALGEMCSGPWDASKACSREWYSEQPTRAFCIIFARVCSLLSLCHSHSIV